MSLTSSLLKNEREPRTESLRTSDITAPMKIVIYTSGSRGDVQPYIAMGLHLKENGHDVYIATEKRMESLVQEFGMQYRHIAGDPTGFLFQPGASEQLANASMFQLISITEKWDKQFPKDVTLASYVTAAEGAELILSAGLTMTGSYCVAEKMNVPWIPLILGATMPTSEFPLWPMESVAICSCMNKWTYNMAFKMLWNSEAKFINPWRTEVLGLPPITHARGIADIIDLVEPPVIVACSKKIVGKTGEIPSDYSCNIYFPGFFYVPSTPTENIHPQLISFLEDNPRSHRTIYLGFGSMPTGSPLDLVKLAVETCTTMICRAVLVAGWSILDTDECQELLRPMIEGGQIIVVKAVAHDWLFPRVDCIVHHCGVGTMAAAFRAGKPQIPCPVMLDQPYNARTVLRLGCALDYIPYEKLTSTKLSRALERVFCDEQNIFEVAEEIKRDISEESDSALDDAYEVIMDYATKFRF